MWDFLTSLFKGQKTFSQPVGGPVGRTGSMVVAYHPRLRDIGHSVLDAGGNAFDAFVAVTAAQNVMAEGASSLAGPLGVLLYRAADRQVVYLDADFNDPLSPDWRFEPDMLRDGRAVLVPGAPAGLQALARDLATWSLGDLLQPAIELAEEGFPVSRLLSTFIAWRANVLKASDYGRRTFLSPSGKPLQPGQTIRQPEVASFLANLGRQGASYVYSGDWGKQFLRVVAENKGILSTSDLEQYQVCWVQPWTTTYRGHTLFSSSGHAYGGLWTLLALKTLEHAQLATDYHYSARAESLECLVRVARRVWAEGWLLDYKALDDRELVASRLSPDYTKRLWEEASASGPATGAPGTRPHSYHIIVVDRSGNVASGTTTIQSDPWGAGLFVEGLPLTTAGTIPWNTAPGTRRLSPFSIHFAFRDRALRYAVGGISNSVVEAAFQFLVNLIDYQLPVHEAVSMPRFGTFPAGRKTDTGRNWLDPRIPDDVVRTLKKQQLKFQRRGVIDTGCGAILAAGPSAKLSGVVAPVPYVDRPFSTEP